MVSKREEERRKEEAAERYALTSHWSFTQTLPEGEGPNALVHEPEFKRLVKGKTSRCILLFHAKWCPPSRFVRKHYDARAAASRTRLYLVDVDKEDTAAISKTFGIVCTPVLLYLVGGVEKGRMEGISPKFSKLHP